jgi:RNA polymerase-binding transcription factor
MTAVKFPLKVLKPVKLYLKEYQDKLLKRKKELEKEDPFNDVDRVNDNAAIDTEAKEEIGHDRISALKLEIDKTLVRVKKALTKIKVGKYGICDHCGQMIDTDRLAVDPTTVTCIKCVKKNKSLT